MTLIELSDATYRLLIAQTNRLHLSSAQLLERLGIGDLSLPPLAAGAHELATTVTLDNEAAATADSTEALAAVERLTK